MKLRHMHTHEKRQLAYIISVFLCATSHMSWCLQDPRSNGSASKGRLSPALVSQFDLVTCYSSSSSSNGDGDFEERLVKHLLDLSPEDSETDSQDRASLTRCLQEHLRKAANIAAPKPSKQASLMLQNYYPVTSWRHLRPGACYVSDMDSC